MAPKQVEKPAAPLPIPLLSPLLATRPGTSAERLAARLLRAEHQALEEVLRATTDACDQDLPRVPRIDSNADETNTDDQPGPALHLASGASGASGSFGTGEAGNFSLVRSGAAGTGEAGDNSGVRSEAAGTGEAGDILRFRSGAAGINEARNAAPSCDATAGTELGHLEGAPPEEEPPARNLPSPFTVTVGRPFAMGPGAFAKPPPYVGQPGEFEDWRIRFEAHKEMVLCNGLMAAQPAILAITFSATVLNVGPSSPFGTWVMETYAAIRAAHEQGFRALALPGAAPHAYLGSSYVMADGTAVADLWDTWVALRHRRSQGARQRRELQAAPGGSAA